MGEVNEDWPPQSSRGRQGQGWSGLQERRCNGVKVHLNAT
jgi:hypothetical protein